MAMFTGGGEADKSGPRSALAREPGLSIVAVGMRISGELDTNGVVKVEGTIEGSVRAERQVLVAKGGRVQGDIYTREALVGGEVKGAIYADDRVEVQASSVIEGDITTQRLVVQEGGEVNGRIQMANPDALSGPKAKTPGSGRQSPLSDPSSDRGSHAGAL